MGYLGDFLDLYPRPNTQSTYRYALKVFFREMYPDSDQNEYQLADRYMRDDRDYECDIQTYQQAIHSRPPKTVRSLLAAVKMFLIESDIELPQKFWRRELAN